MKYTKVIYYCQKANGFPSTYAAICGSGSYKMIDGHPVFVHHIKDKTYIATQDIVVELLGLYTHDELQFVIYNKLPAVIVGNTVYKFHTTLERPAITKVFKTFKWFDLKELSFDLEERNVHFKRVMMDFMRNDV